MKFHLLLRQRCLHFRMFRAYDLQEVLSERLRAQHLLLVGATTVMDVSSADKAGRDGGDSRYVDEHGLVVLVAGVLVNESRTLTLDLHTSTCLLLDVLDEHTLYPS